MAKETGETVEDLQAVSQQMLDSTARIEALEAEKRIVDPGSARFRELSDEIEVLAEEMRRVSHAETGLATELSNEPNLPTVADADADAEQG